MLGFFFVMIMLVCVLLVLIILIQNPKGGGLSSSFGGSGTQLFGGVKKTTDFLDRGTWALSIVLLALVLFVNVQTNSGNEGQIEESQLNEVIENSQAIPPSNINTIPPTQSPSGNNQPIEINTVEEGTE